MSRARLRRGSAPPPERATALVIPVELGAAGKACRARFDREAARGMPAHVTLLYPFVSSSSALPYLEQIGEAARATEPFEFELVGLGRFRRVTYLVPEPRHAFVEMIRRFSDRFPDWPPYEGAFSDVIPHVSIASRARLPDRFRWAVQAELPSSRKATVVELLAEERDRWHVLERFSLGRSPSDSRPPG